MKTTMTALLLAGLSAQAQSALLISEVLYDAPNNDSVEEFIELYNSGCESIDLSQYQLSDNNTSLSLSGTLAPGKYYTLAINADGFNNLFGSAPNYAPLPFSLGNSGDFVKLTRGTEQADVVAWEGGLSGWTLNVRDISLERTTVQNTQSQADWSAASSAGTPGTGELAACNTTPVPDNMLTKGDVRTSLSAAKGQALAFIADIPQSATNLVIKLSGGSGDADLYVRQGAKPTLTQYDCAPYLGGNNEQCDFATPTAGRWYIDVQAYSSFSGASLSLDYQQDSTGGSGGETGGGETGGGSEPDPAGYSFNTYYAQAIGKSGTELKSALNLIIRGHTRYSYAQVWDGLNYSDEDPANPDNVILLYTGRSEPKTNRAGMSSSLDAWNREHVWAKSHGFPDSSSHAYTDLHHLRPADVTVNSSRSNKDFAMGGTPLDEAPANSTDSDSFEPADAVKGDVARMLMYMDVRYEGDAASATPDLVLVSGITGSEPKLGDLCTLLAWHNQDPVSDWERRRNNRVYEWQHNRNPFIDNPDWANTLFSSSCN